MWVQPAQAHIEKILLSKAPSIAFHVGTKIEFRHFGSNGTIVGLTRSHFKLGFLSYNRDFVVTLGAQKSGNRAEMASRADNKLES